MNEKEKEIQSKLIVTMAYIEEFSDENHLVPPIEVSLTDASGHDWQFDYHPESDWVDMERRAPKLPVAVLLRDSEGTIVEARITTFSLPARWMAPFLQ